LRGYSWNIPNNLTFSDNGEAIFNVTVTIDTGLFGGRLEGSKKITVKK
jgi:hypothetical protein